MDDEIRIVTSDELRAEEEKKKEHRKEVYREACMLMMQGIDKLAAAGSRMDSGSPELFSLLEARLKLSEPLARAQAECGFQDWMYSDWKKEQQKKEQTK